MRFRLHWAPTSPYVRKVMVAAHELGLADRLELVPTRVETVVADVAGDNPLGRIPALVLPDGTTLFDSLVIAEFLDEAGGGGLFPRGPGRWRTLTLHALGHGVIDAAIAIVSERRRPERERSPAFVAARHAEIDRALDALERQPPPSAPDIGTITAAVALGYVDFRFPDYAWRPDRPRLGAWFEDFAARPSMQATKPPA